MCKKNRSFFTKIFFCIPDAASSVRQLSFVYKLSSCVDGYFLKNLLRYTQQKQFRGGQSLSNEIKSTEYLDRTRARAHAGLPIGRDVWAIDRFFWLRTWHRSPANFDISQEWMFSFSEQNES